MGTNYFVLTILVETRLQQILHFLQLLPPDEDFVCCKMNDSPAPSDVETKLMRVKRDTPPWRTSASSLFEGWRHRKGLHVGTGSGTKAGHAKHAINVVDLGK